MPSSSTLVATITQSSRLAKACSAWCRCSGLSELCVTKVVTSELAQLGGELLRPRPAVDEDQPLFAAVEARDNDGGIVQRTDEVQPDIGRCGLGAEAAGRCLVRPDRSRPAIRGDLRGFPTVAESPIRWISRPARLRDAAEDREQVPTAVVPRERVDLIDDHGAEVRRAAPTESIDCEIEHHLERFGRGEQAIGRFLLRSSGEPTGRHRRARGSIGGR